MVGMLACGTDSPPDPEPVECEPLSGPWVEADGRVNGDVLALAVLADGTVLTGTQFGIVALDPVSKEWGPRIDFAAPVTSISVDPAEPNHLFATSLGIHESSDGGRSWELVLADPDPGMVAFAPGAPGRAYALLGTRALRTDDGGASWTVVSTDRPGSTTSLIVASGDPDAIYTTWGDPFAVHAVGSDDGGVTWFETVGMSDVVAAGGMKMYGGGAMGVHRSDDAGRTWTFIAFHADVVPVAIAVDPGPPEMIYSAGWARVHASDDGALTWTQWLDFPPIGWPDTMVIGPDRNLYIGAERGSAVLELGDGGDEVHWYGGGISGEGRRLAEPVNGLLYVATSDGVFMSGHAGITWGTIASQLPIVTPSTFVPTVLVAPSDLEVMYVHYESGAGGSGSLARTDDGALTWNTLAPADAPPVAVDPLAPHVLYWIVNGILYLTDDDDDRGFIGLDIHPGRVTSVFPDRIDPEALLVAAGDQLVRIRDRGASQAELFAPDSELGGIVDVYTTGAGELLISFDSGRLARGDAGGGWTIVEPELGGAVPAELTADPSSARGVFALIDGRIHRSPDLGTTWCEVDSSIGAVTGLASLGGSVSILVASTGSRLYRIAIE